MDAIDTNVLLRYLTADDANQHKKAVNVIESGDPKLVSPIVIAELSWVLKSVYELKPETIIELIRLIGNCGYFSYKKPEAVKLAIEDFASGFDLADALIGRLNSEDGANTTYTFDRKAGKLATYRLI